MMVQVSCSEVTGNTQITVDEADLALLQKAVWDEQTFLVQTMRSCPNHRERLWTELSERWIPLARAIGAGVVLAKYEEIVRKGVEG